MIAITRRRWSVTVPPPVSTRRTTATRITVGMIFPTTEGGAISPDTDMVGLHIWLMAGLPTWMAGGAGIPALGTPGSPPSRGAGSPIISEDGLSSRDLDGLGSLAILHRGPRGM